MQKPPYTQEISRHHPGLFVILLDQSHSMGDPIKGFSVEQTKADVVTRHINIMIQEMIDRAAMEETKTGFRRKYAYLSVLGYNDTVKSLLAEDEAPIDIPTLATNPLGMVPEEHPVYQNGVHIRTDTEYKRFWIQPKWYDKADTNMTLAFEHARNVVKNWLDQDPEEISPALGYQQPRMESFPPVIINVTDGYYTTGGNPRRIVESIWRMGTHNGNVLVFNCHFTTENNNKLIFPDNIRQVFSRGEFAEEMFHMSSIIPDPLLNRASREMFNELERGARGVIYDADFDILARFLKWGTGAFAP